MSESFGGCMSALNNHKKERDSSSCRNERNTFIIIHISVIGVVQI